MELTSRPKNKGMKPVLTVEKLILEAKKFCRTTTDVPELYGVTDGKAVGTLIEQRFKKFLADKFEFVMGNSANGIDLPGDEIKTDIKVTSVRQPQSSCPFRSARQKIFGLGYNLLVFVYDKKDDPEGKTALLDFVHCSFIEKERTGDYTTTYRLRQMIEDGAVVEDVWAYLQDRNLPADEDAVMEMAEQIIANPPEQGYLTISNALQWRLQYARVVNLNKTVDGIIAIIDKVNI